MASNGGGGRSGGGPSGTTVTDKQIMLVFERADIDKDNLLCDVELQEALSPKQEDCALSTKQQNCEPKFSLRTAQLLIYMFTDPHSKAIGRKKFIPLYRSMDNWKETFNHYDKGQEQEKKGRHDKGEDGKKKGRDAEGDEGNKKGRLSETELKEALTFEMQRDFKGFNVSPSLLKLLMSKFKNPDAWEYGVIEYDYFIECCILVKGLIEKFNSTKKKPKTVNTKEDSYCGGTASFTCDDLLLGVLPLMLLL